MVTKKDNIPTNLGLKIGTDRAKRLLDIKKKVEDEIEMSKITILINEDVLKTLEKAIKAEEEKLK